MKCNKMNTKIIVIIFAALGFSAFLGWHKASDSSMESSETADSWNNLVQTNITHPDYGSIARQIRISGILPIGANTSDVQTKSGQSVEVIDDGEAPNFPQIVATAIIDGVPQVTLYSDDKSVLSSRSGDVLENGWEIVKVELSNIVAAFDGQQHNFPVLSYDPFAGGEELVENKN